MTETCEHELIEAPDYYATDCGSHYWSNATSGQELFKFCPYCGGFVEYEEPL